ncbi:hypothetical protein BDV38DRAFT_265158 [Aspergillus pseudotamarii]|uniref:Uncharacterized protein n=1 Tax=Aspergillus pseudotamarii TaxID=132259 RepID=A0A5N6SC00_ASPPS|nr:uncharacterized protein BDV38DRAFT_265158 [Aspergillus pseudotamarii]KAE8131210.1 hypothetical protein BDV38DRAFT_265158 [Aspergillus pseudotamarii]
MPYPIQIWIPAKAICFTTVMVPLNYCLNRSTIYHRPLSIECREIFSGYNTKVTNPEKYLS